MGTKQVLMVAYLFPPLGGIAVQRPLKFARYLRDYGWDPVVLTTEDAYSAFYDPSLLEELPRDVEVIRRKDPLSGIMKRVGSHAAADAGASAESIIKPNQTARPRALKSILGRMKNSLLVPDESVLWAWRAAIAGKRLIEKARRTDRPINCLYTTSGPQSTHLVGWLLKRWTGIKWVADFRDPWTQNMHFTHTGLRRRIEEWLEFHVFAEADAILTVTDGFTKLFQAKYPKFAGKVQLIRNGVDPADFPNITSRKPTERLTLFYGGILYPKRSPAALFQALNAGLRYGKLKPNQIRIQFAGVFDYPGRTDNHDLIRELNLQSVVEVLGCLPHAEVLKKAQEADALLLIGERTGGENPYVAGKLYEYLCVNKPILAMLEPGEAARLIKQENAGTVVDPGDMGGILKTLLSLVEEHQRKFQHFLLTNERTANLEPVFNGEPAQNMRVTLKYTRQGQTHQLASLLNHLIESDAVSSAEAAAKTARQAHFRA